MYKRQSQDLIIREIDCAEGKDEIPGMWVSEFTDGKEHIESLQDRITGRFSCETIKDKDGNVIVKANHMITPKRAARVIKDGINENGEHYTKVKIRTILTCRSGNGICAKCYGANMATGEAVQVGESVGIIAAQSIGEPGTQLTMRTFHTGGVAGGDITQGLPRVEELFEARKPKGLAIITEIAGVAPVSYTHLDVYKRHVFSVATALIPFLQNDDANRALMGSNMQRQAVPLMITDAPVVGTGIEAKAAVDSGVCVVAKKAGTISYSCSNEIRMNNDDGTKDVYHLTKFMRSNQSNCYNQKPIVFKGDHVEAGEVIADGPSTYQGELALGKNPLIGFMTWEGYNYEDAVLLSERLVQDDVYTSIHIEEYEAEARDTKLGPEEDVYKRQFLHKQDRLGVR